MNLAQRALRGTFFVAAGSYLSLLIYFVTGIILARRLEPADFGLFRLALFYVDLFGRLREFGLDKALMHRQEGLERAFRTHFTLQSVLAGVTLAVSVLAAPWLLKFYSPAVVLFIVFISTASVFQALGTTQRVALEKNLNFRVSVAIDLVSLILSSFISILMAFHGFGALSLVTGYGSNFLFSFIGLWLVRPWPVRVGELWLFDRREMGWFLKFGSFLFVGGITTFILYKYNDFVLGTFLSVSALGFYSRAFNYAQIPTSLITSVISKVALPTYSRLQSDPTKLTEAFTIVLKTIVRVAFPLSLILYLVADDFTVLVLGPKWLPMVPVFRVLLIYGVLRSIFDDLGELFTAVGQPRLVSFYLSLQAGVSLVLSPILTFFYQAEGAGLSLSLILVLGVIVAYRFLGRVIRINGVAIFLPTTLVCLLTTVSFKLWVTNFAVSGIGLWPALVIKGGIFAVLYAFFLCLIEGRALIRDCRYIAAHWQTREQSVTSPALEL